MSIRVLTDADIKPLADKLSLLQESINDLIELTRSTSNRQEEEEPKVLSVRDIQYRFAISGVTLQKIRRNPLFPSSEFVRNRYHFDREEIDAFFEKNYRDLFDRKRKLALRRNKRGEMMK